MRGCSEGGSLEDSVTSRWRWAWRVTTRGRARPPLVLTFMEGERASAPMEKRNKWSLGCPLVVQNLLGFFADVGRTQRFLPTSPLQEKFVRILHHQQRGGPAWSHSDTKDFSTAVSEGVGDTSVESLLHWLVGSRRALIRLARVPLLLALQKVTMLLVGLSPFGRSEPFCLYDSAELRLACWEKYTTGVRVATVNS